MDANNSKNADNMEPLDPCDITEIQNEWFAALETQVGSHEAVVSALANERSEGLSNKITIQTTVNNSILLIVAQRKRILEGPFQGKTTVEVKVLGKATESLQNVQDINHTVTELMPSIYRWLEEAKDKPEGFVLHVERE